MSAMRSDRAGAASSNRSRGRAISVSVRARATASPSRRRDPRGRRRARRGGGDGGRRDGPPRGRVVQGGRRGAAGRAARRDGAPLGDLWTHAPARGQSRVALTTGIYGFVSNAVSTVIRSAVFLGPQVWK